MSNANTLPSTGFFHVAPLSLVMYSAVAEPTYHACSFVGSTSIACTQASPIGRITLLQLKPATCCGGIVTTGMLNGQVAAAALPHTNRSTKRSTRLIGRSIAYLCIHR